MATKTQGTHLYTIDPADDSVITVGCVLSIDGIDSTNEQLEKTCLSDLAREYESGLATPGSASFGINFDTGDATHVRLHALKVAGTTLKWAVGLSDGTAVPAVDSSGDFVLASSRSYIQFDGYMSNFPFSIAQNAFVNSTVGIQISGEPTVAAKSA